MTQQFAKFVLVIGVLSTSIALGQKLQTAGNLTVFDADGKRVGQVMDAGVALASATAVNVAFRVDGVPFVLSVYRDGFNTPTVVFPPVIWESSDCSGKPFLGVFTFRGTGVAPSGGSLPLVAVGFPGNTVYVEDGPTQTVTIGSFSSPTVAALAVFPPSDLPLSQCINLGDFVGEQAVVFPARALINLNDEFRAPFAVK